MCGCKINLQRLTVGEAWLYENMSTITAKYSMYFSDLIRYATVDINNALVENKGGKCNMVI